MENEKYEVRKDPMKFIKNHLDYDPDIYDGVAEIDKPQILTKNTICSTEGISPDTHWIRIPDSVIRKLGMRVTYARTDFEVIVKRKVEELEKFK